MTEVKLTERAQMLINNYRQLLNVENPKKNTATRQLKGVGMVTI